MSDHPDPPQDEPGPPPALQLVGSTPPGGVSGRDAFRQDHAQRLIPRSVKTALAVVGVEALVMVLMIAYLVSTLVQDVQVNTGVTVATTVFTALMLLGLLAGGLAVLRGRRWGRSPLVGWQILQLGVALPSLGAGRWWLGAGLVVLSVLGLGSLLSPGVTRHLHWRELPPGGLL